MSLENLPQTEEEWSGILTPEQYRVLRQKGTERPFTGEYNSNKAKGVYRCAGCGEPLFTSEAKFDSGCGWPSFYEGLDKDKIEEHVDLTHGMRRVEVTCKRCGGHLGHVFPDAPQTPTGMRYCINSVSLNFEPGT
jgi:peptide-methionine (R)-S-oxide reductase